MLECIYKYGMPITPTFHENTSGYFPNRLRKMIGSPYSLFFMAMAVSMVMLTNKEDPQILVTSLCIIKYSATIKYTRIIKNISFFEVYKNKGGFLKWWVTWKRLFILSFVVIVYLHKLKTFVCFSHCMSTMINSQLKKKKI